MDKIAIFTEASSFFSAPLFAEWLNCPLYVITAGHNFYKSGVDEIRKRSDIDCENLIIIGYRGLRMASQDIEKGRYKTVSVIFSDSSACLNYRWWNDFIVRNNIFVYAMPDIDPFIKCDYVPVYPVLNLNKIEPVGSNGRIVVGHGPSCPTKQIYKGTHSIQDKIELLQENIDFDFSLITRLSYKESLQEKAKCQIFIDQLVFRNADVPQNRWGNEITYNGGLGKSGIEAMMLGCCVITGGKPPDTGKYYPQPPVIWTDDMNFYMDLKDLIQDSEYRAFISDKQWAWVKKYITWDFMGNLLISHIR